MPLQIHSFRMFHPLGSERAVAFAGRHFFLVCTQVCILVGFRDLVEVVEEMVVAVVEEMVEDVAVSLYWRNPTSSIPYSDRRRLSR